MIVRVFANGSGDLGSIPGRIIPKTQKWYLMPPCLTLRIVSYQSRVKWGNPGKEVAPSPKPCCSSYRKGSLRFTLDNCCYFYFNFTFNKNHAGKNIEFRQVCFTPPTIFTRPCTKKFPSFSFTKWGKKVSRRSNESLCRKLSELEIS